MLACADYGESLVVEKFFDAEHALDIAAAVHALAGAAFYRFQLRELALPEAQHVGGKPA